MKTVVANYILWPGAHFINFKFVPTEHRILYNNCVSVRRPPAAHALHTREQQLTPAGMGRSCGACTSLWWQTACWPLATPVPSTPLAGMRLFSMLYVWQSCPSRRLGGVSRLLPGFAACSLSMRGD